ncbi:MAG: hypothetical protein ACRDIU_10770 [Actinomycetota bacterium]
MDPVFIKGLASFLVMVVVFVGSGWLLLSMILGVRLGYFVMASCFFGVMMLVAAIWFATGLGPKGDDGFWGDLGEETAWHSLAAGPDLGEVDSEFGEYDISDFPGGEWKETSEEAALADVDDISTELANAKPSLEAIVNDAVSEIEAKREEAKEHMTGEISLKADEFEITEVRMKEMNVKGKPSVVAVGMAVPSAEVASGNLGGAAEGEVTKFLANVGDTLSPGTPVMEIKAAKAEAEAEGESEEQTDAPAGGSAGGPAPADAEAGAAPAPSAPPPGARIVLAADKAGKLVRFGFKVGDKIKPDVPMATIDVTGQPGAPQAAEVAAIRVRGSVRVPSFIYLAVSTLLLLIHLAGLARVEKRQKAVPQAT